MRLCPIFIFFVEFIFLQLDVLLAGAQPLVRVESGDRVGERVAPGSLSLCGRLQRPRAATRAKQHGPMRSLRQVSGVEIEFFVGVVRGIR